MRGKEKIFRPAGHFLRKNEYLSDFLLKID